MPPEMIIVPIVFALPSAVIVIRMWFRHQEKMAGLGRPLESTPAIEARLERVEQSLEAIAVEMERVGEGQRFLTKLLSDRTQALPTSAPATPPRINTPH
ncbi:MAG: hypothetical protein JWM41_1324 [Gemmatimonadetes bacterium]|nr:hypothetical protein [Gemmatimonadota bacterium]